MQRSVVPEAAGLPVGVTVAGSIRYPWMYQRAKKWAGARHFLPTWSMNAPAWDAAYMEVIDRRLAEAGKKLGK